MVSSTTGARTPTSWRHGLDGPAVDGDATPPVLVGLDGGLGGELALAWAIAEAVALGAPVLALTAWSWDARLLAAAGGRPSRQAGRVRGEQEDQIARALGRLGPVPCRIDTELVEGDPASTLVVRSASARLLVVGSHAAPGRTAVGSVARACIRAAACPVVVVPVRATA